MTITRDFKLHLNDGSSSPLMIRANQYDSGEIWRFTLFGEDGVKYIPSSAVIIGTTASGALVTRNATIESESGKVVVKETRTMTQSAGKNEFELVVDDGAHGTANFFVDAEPRPNKVYLTEHDLKIMEGAIEAGAAVGDLVPRVNALQADLQNEATDRAEADAVLRKADAVLRKAIDDAAIVPAGSTVVVDSSLSISGSAADAKKTGDAVSGLNNEVNNIKEDLGDTNTICKFGINLLPNEIHMNEWKRGDNLKAEAYKGWCWFEIKFPKVSVGNELHIALYSLENNSRTEESVTYCWTYWNTERQDYDIGRYEGKLSEFRINYKVGQVFVSIPISLLKKDIVVCNVLDSSKITKETPRVEIVSKSGNSYTLDGGYIIDICNPYFHQDVTPDKNITIKFDYIKYSFNGYTYTYPFSDFLNENFVTSWEYDYNYMTNVGRFLLNENQSLIFDFAHHSIKISEKPEKNEAILINVSNNKAKGIYFDFLKYYGEKKYGDEKYQKLSKTIYEKIDKKMESFIELANAEIFTFPYVADNHQGGFYYDVVNDTTLALEHTLGLITPDTIINAGDSMLDYNPSSNVITSFFKQFDGVNKREILYCQGNHDRKTSTPQLTRTAFFNLIYRSLLNDDTVHFGKIPGTYYYKDFEKFKIRVIVMDLYNIPEKYNANEHPGYDGEQLSWLCDTALQINPDWQVMIVTHSAPYDDTEGMTNNTGGHSNRIVFRKILENFVNGTSETLSNTDTLDDIFTFNRVVDFTSQGKRTLIGVFTGHNHTDVILKKNGINYISTMCGYIDIVLYKGKRIPNEYSAIAFDFVFIDTKSKKVTMKRIGYGDDREFTY